jgi:hypothetical protein
MNRNQQKTFIQFKMENRTSFISCGITVTIMNGFREPTQVNPKYQHQHQVKNFLMYRLEASS